MTDRKKTIKKLIEIKIDNCEVYYTYLISPLKMVLNIKNLVYEEDVK